VLPRDIHGNTALRLEPMIPRLKAEGCRFATLDEPGFAAELR